MKTFIRPFGAALVLGLAALAAHAQTEDFRIGFVNIDRLLREANPAKVGQSKLEAEFSKREKDLMEAGNVLKAASEKFEREAPTLAESQRTARQRQLVEQDRDFQRKRREFQEDLNLRKNEELQQVIDKANRIIRQVAETEKYDAILQEAAYINPKHDITDKVIKALNVANPAK
jgi:outer membrane protein